ncbi:AbiV family abortive infection protein [Nakamurella sp. GG22]
MVKAKNPQAETISATAARKYWRALMTNVVSLVDSADTLAEESPSLSRSLLILAQEEAGKANELYIRSQRAWSDGLDVIELDEQFLKMERWHHPKIIASLQADAELDPFWGDCTSYDFDPNTMDMQQYVSDRIDAEDTYAKGLNRRKQAGFYVDRDGESVNPPQDVTIEDIRAEIVRTAGVAEMLLITDNSRMQRLPENKFDSTHDLQMALMPYSHPQEFADWLNRQG